jgi:peptidoglycan/xylan/chitin deacetylase (PgdA/CDA1 family)
MEMPSMTRKFALLLAVIALQLVGCDKIRDKIPFLKKKAKPEAVATPAPATPAPVAADSAPATDSAAPAPATTKTSPKGGDTPAAPAPSAVAVNKTASVIALCYHNIEDGSKMRALTISVAEFEKEMQAIKDNGFTVIPMQDFLAWRRGEKSLPNKSCIITIDDGWVSAYNNAWPILKKFNYPFTLFIYINYVGTGGKSMSWDQLAEMRDAGADIESHTYSHADLKKPGALVDKKAADGIRNDIKTLGEDGWLRKEIIGSKEVLEKKLGIKCNAFAYPFGLYNQKALDMVKEAGYEAAFTVYGQLLQWSAPKDRLGRYAVEASKPQIFNDAMKMIGGGLSPVSGGASAEPTYQQLAVVSMVTKPMDGETINDPKPLIKANLATLGEATRDEMEFQIRPHGGALRRPGYRRLESATPQALRVIPRQPRGIPRQTRNPD